MSDVGSQTASGPRFLGKGSAFDVATPSVASVPSRTFQARPSDGRRRMIRMLLASTRRQQHPEDDRVTRAVLGVLRYTGSKYEIRQILESQVGVKLFCCFCRKRTFSRQLTKGKFTYQNCRSCHKQQSRVLTPPAPQTPQTTASPVREFCVSCRSRTRRTPTGACVDADNHALMKWCSPCGRRTSHDPATYRCLFAGHARAA